MTMILIITQVLPPLFWMDPDLPRHRRSIGVDAAGGYPGHHRLLQCGIIDVQCWSSVLVGMAAFVAAWWLFDRCVRDEDAQAPDRLVVRATSRLRLFGMARPSDGLAAVVWKDFHFACGGRAMSLINPLMMIALIAGVVLFSKWVSPGMEFRYIGETTQIVAFDVAGDRVRHAPVADLRARDALADRLQPARTAAYRDGARLCQAACQPARLAAGGRRARDRGGGGP